jgi:hypothetical protein
LSERAATPYLDANATALARWNLQLDGPVTVDDRRGLRSQQAIGGATPAAKVAS